VKTLFLAAAALALTVTVVLGAANLAASPGKGEGHTPVVVCHWVPAHGGSYVVITVDDDGADGNKNLQAHEGHANDIIAPESGECPAKDDDYDYVED
jgi:hypothetical protein